MRTKVCPTCEEKPVKEFGTNRQSPDGLHYYCKTCSALRQRAWHANNPEKSRANRQRYLQKLHKLNAERDPYAERERRAA